MQLKYLTLLSKETVDYSVLLKEGLGLKTVRWYHTMYFIRSFKKLAGEVEVLRNLDPKAVEESEVCTIKRPPNIDSISYGAMIELQVLFQNPGEKEIGELITESIQIACYESHTKNLYDSDTESFKQFKNTVSEQDLVQMLGLYNWIDREITASVKKWNKLFSDVKVEDQDWDNAGGSMLSKFDIVNSIRKICSSFNLDYYRALQLPYGLTQASSLSDATRFFIQDRMRVAIESRMKTKREAQK
jgi:hypothetical protein